MNSVIYGVFACVCWINGMESTSKYKNPLEYLASFNEMGIIMMEL